METFKYVAPIAGALKYSAEDTAVAIGLMANAGKHKCLAIKKFIVKNIGLKIGRLSLFRYANQLPLSIGI